MVGTRVKILYGNYTIICFDLYNSYVVYIIEARKEVCMKKFQEYIICIFGAALVATGVYFFKMPNNFSTGGVTGISVVLSGFFKLQSASIIASALNILMLILGFLVLGKQCGLKIVLGSISMSATLLLLEFFIPMRQPLTDEPFLELIFAVLLPGVGSAILFNINGSTGGTDIIAMILRKFTSINIGLALFLSDLIITLGAFLFGVKVGLFSLLGLLSKTMIVDTVIESINTVKCFSIITLNPGPISEFITTKLRRSTTVIDAVGGYTNENKKVVVTVMNRMQAIQLRRYLKEHYPEAFIIITNSSEIIGKGFRGVN
ncbi:MAG TPA: YitT family protein [Clostridia bacterium]|nr:YitT family protein [Clostridia bacterium]